MTQHPALRVLAFLGSALCAWGALRTVGLLEADLLLPFVLAFPSLSLASTALGMVAVHGRPLA